MRTPSRSRLIPPPSSGGSWVPRWASTVSRVVYTGSPPGASAAPQAAGLAVVGLVRAGRGRVLLDLLAEVLGALVLGLRGGLVVALHAPWRTHGSLLRHQEPA